MIRWLAVLSLLCSSLPAFAWGELGHQVVGELAERRLSPAARDAVRALLADEPVPTLAAVATWADAVRGDDAWAWSAPLHYVNVRDRRCRYDAARDCRNGDCVVGAIARYAGVLADRAQPRAVRAEALKFVVHFVGDVHQPLHAGRRPDKGGNDFQISLRRAGREPQGTNLHGVWDYFVLAERGEDLPTYADRLAATMPELPTRPTPFVVDEAAQWAQASCALTDGDGFYPRRPGRLPDGYLQAMQPLADARLQLAATQLARVIETALAPTR